MNTKNPDGVGGRNYLSALQVRGGQHIPFSEGVPLREPEHREVRTARWLRTRIEATEAEREPLRIAHAAAVDRVFEITAAYRAAGSPSEQGRLISELTEARADLAAAVASLERVQAKLIDLHRERDARHWAASVAAS